MIYGECRVLLMRYLIFSRTRIPNEDFDVGGSFFDEDFDLNFSDFDEDSETNSVNESFCSSCSCSRCDSGSCGSFETINNNKDTAGSGYKRKMDKR